MKSLVYPVLALLAGCVLLLVLFGVFARPPASPEPPADTFVDTFERCVAAGYPVMESYPRQCRAGDTTYTETPAEQSMSELEARAIAEATCVKGGESLAPGTYNAFTRTWWFDANLNATREGCNPACVVSEQTQAAEINWRCTGLIVPE